MSTPTCSSQSGRETQVSEIPESLGGTDVETGGVPDGPCGPGDPGVGEGTKVGGTEVGRRWVSGGRREDQVGTGKHK